MISYSDNNTRKNYLFIWSPVISTQSTSPEMPTYPSEGELLWFAVHETCALGQTPSVHTNTHKKIENQPHVESTKDFGYQR